MRLHSQGTRDGHTLAHSSRKLMRKLVFKAVETDKIDVVPREFLALVRGQPLHFETESNVLGNIHPGKQRVVLENHRVLPAGHTDGHTVDGDAAGRGRFETRCNVQQGCLAATAVTEDRTELVVRNLEGHIAKRHHGFCLVRVAVDLGQVFDSEMAHLTPYLLSANDQGRNLRPKVRIAVSIKSPTRPMVSMPTTIVSVRNMLRASLMRKPSPEFAPTSSAATSAIQPTPRPMRTPVTICGSAARNTTWLSTTPSLLPRQRAARTRLGSTPFTPLMVLSRMGKKMPRKMMNSFCRSPMPNQRIDSGIHASGGMGRSTSTSGSNCSLKPFHQSIA